MIEAKSGWSRVFLACAAGLVACVGFALGPLLRTAPHRLVPSDAAVVLLLRSEPAIWQFIPMDVLPGAAELDDTPPPPP
jgi:hypothetical protein